MTRHLWREGVVPVRAADSAWRGVHGTGHGGVGGDFAGGDLLEEGVDALLEGGDFLGADGWHVGWSACCCCLADYVFDFVD